MSRDEIVLLLHYKDKIAEKLNLCDTILFDELQQEQVLTEEEAQSINVHRVIIVNQFNLAAIKLSVLKALNIKH